MADTAALQVQNRSGFLGGSDIAAVLGISPYKTAYQLWEEKLGLEPETDEQKERIFRRGKRLEPVVIEMLQDEHDTWVAERNAVYYDGEHGWMRAEIDFEWIETEPNGAATEVQNGDVKTVHPNKSYEWGVEGSDEFPAYYACQFQWGMMLTGARKCLVAALIGADDLRLYQVVRDDEYIAHIRQQAVYFWNNHVLAQEPPSIVSSEDAQRAISKFDGCTIQTTDDVTESCRRIHGIKKAQKRLEEARSKEELSIQLRMALATDAVREPTKFAVVNEAGKPMVTWNNITRAGYTAVIKPTTYRKFTVK